MGRALMVAALVVAAAAFGGWWMVTERDRAAAERAEAIRAKEEAAERARVEKRKAAPPKSLAKVEPTRGPESTEPPPPEATWPAVLAHAKTIADDIEAAEPKMTAAAKKQLPDSPRTLAASQERDHILQSGSLSASFDDDAISRLLEGGLKEFVACLRIKVGRSDSDVTAVLKARFEARRKAGPTELDREALAVVDGWQTFGRFAPRSRAVALAALKNYYTGQPPGFLDGEPEAIFRQFVGR